jgi:hypothetical protein
MNAQPSTQFAIKKTDVHNASDYGNGEEEEEGKDKNIDDYKLE